MNKATDDRLIWEAYRPYDSKDAISTVFADPTRPARRGLSGILTWLSDGIMYNPKTGEPRYNKATIIRELKDKAHLSDDQVQHLEKSTQIAAKRAQETILAKYPDIINWPHVKINLVNDSSFQKYCIWTAWRDPDIEVEFNKLFRNNLENILK